MNNFAYAQVKDVPEAARAGREPGAKFIAGGTDLMQLMKDDVEAPERLVDLAGLPLEAVQSDAEELRIGALARMSDVAANPVVVHDYPMIAEALLASASPQVRNMATMGGNLLQRTRCNYFRDTGFACNKRAPGSGCPAIPGENRNLAILGGSEHCIATHPSDLAVALVALDARVHLHGLGGPRSVPLAGFHLPPGDTPEHETILMPGEVILRIVVPASAAARRSRYLKVRDRASFEFAVVSAAVGLDVADGVIREARVALGGVGTKPWRAPRTEEALRGQPATPELFARAAALATEGARPARDNAFKVVLAQRAVARALSLTA